jgi:hypothetical protein
METAIISQSIAKKVVKENSAKRSTLLSPEFWAAADFNRFGIVPAILTVVTCLSAIAAAFAVYNGLSQLILVGLPTALFLTTIISVAPMRLIFAMAIITTLADLFVFFYH